MKKIFSFAIILGLAGSLFAFENVKVSLTPGFGLMTGQVEEYVFLDNVKGCDGLYTLSRLDWEVKNMPYFSLESDLTVIDHIWIGVKGKVGIPGVYGQMIDNDWNNYKFYTDSATRYQTDYSEHKNKTNVFLDGYLQAGYKFNLPYGFCISPFISLKAQSFSFQGCNGWGQYGYDMSGEWNPDYRKEVITSYKDGHKTSYESRDCVITYEQIRDFYSLGIVLEAQPIKFLRLTACGEWAFFVSVTGIDKHYDEKLNYVEYKDLTKGLNAWDVSGKIEFNFNEHNSLAVSALYEYIPVVSGKTYSRSSSVTKYKLLSSLGGASSSLFSAQLIYTLSL